MKTAKSLSRTKYPHVATNGRSGNGRLSGEGKLPRTMPMGKFLFDYLHAVGVKHSFGVPGDSQLCQLGQKGPDVVKRSEF